MVLDRIPRSGQRTEAVWITNWADRCIGDSRVTICKRDFSVIRRTISGSQRELCFISELNLKWLSERRAVLLCRRQLSSLQRCPVKSALINAAALFAVLFSFIGDGHGQAARARYPESRSYSPGSLWLAWTSAERIGFVRGFIVGHGDG